ncbi:MAG: hypothetical protein CME38_08855 [Haliea sp.]|nr:hypothetical protein [Haliea sp.]
MYLEQDCLIQSFLYSVLEGIDHFLVNEISLFLFEHLLRYYLLLVFFQYLLLKFGQQTQD